MITADRFVRSGKVRDIGTMSDGRMLLVATDRISAFDVVLPTTIPDKGRVLTGLSRFWFRETEGIVPNHLLAAGIEDYRRYLETLLERNQVPRESWAGQLELDDLKGRIMICWPASVVPIEAVVRGYLSGSGWKEYQATGAVCGVALPAGLRESDRLPEPIFTPAAKAPAGHHDSNITFDEIVEHISTRQPESRWLGVRDRAAALEVAERIREVSLRLYRYGAAVAERAGVILADTKFEFGIPASELSPTPEYLGERSGSVRFVHHWGDDGDATPRSTAERLILIDEIMTPDSSRFWDAAAYAPGGPQPSFDKQFVRDWLERQPWDKTDPGPTLPDDIVAGTRSRYIEAYERITGASFERYLREDVIAP